MDGLTSAEVVVDTTVGGVSLPSSVLVSPDGLQMNFFSCRLETTTCRMDDTGMITVDATTGTPIYDGDTFTIDGQDKARKFRMISTGANATLHVRGYRSNARASL